LTRSSLWLEARPPRAPPTSLPLLLYPSSPGRGSARSSKCASQPTRHPRARRCRHSSALCDDDRLSTLGDDGGFPRIACENTSAVHRSITPGPLCSISASHRVATRAPPTAFVAKNASKSTPAAPPACGPQNAFCPDPSAPNERLTAIVAYFNPPRTPPHEAPEPPPFLGLFHALFSGLRRRSLDGLFASPPSDLSSRRNFLKSSLGSSVHTAASTTKHAHRPIAEPPPPPPPPLDDEPTSRVATARASPPAQSSATETTATETRSFRARSLDATLRATIPAASSTPSILKSLWPAYTMRTSAAASAARASLAGASIAVEVVDVVDVEFETRGDDAFFQRPRTSHQTAVTTASGSAKTLNVRTKSTIALVTATVATGSDATIATARATAVSGLSRATDLSAVKSPTIDSRLRARTPLRARADAASGVAVAIETVLTFASRRARPPSRSTALGECAEATAAEGREERRFAAVSYVLTCLPAEPHAAAPFFENAGAGAPAPATAPATTNATIMEKQSQ